MRAPPLSLGLVVALVTVGEARAELPHVVARLAADAERTLPQVHVAPPPLVHGEHWGRRVPARLAVTGTALVPAPPSDVAAVTRVQGMATRALQPRVVVPSRVVRAVRLTPQWPFGIYVTVEYALPARR
jgi:hypothetical protein